MVLKHSIFQNTGQSLLVKLSLISINNCTFDNINTEWNGGALAIKSTVRTDIISSIFRNSSVRGKGGFIHFHVGDELNIHHCQFYHGRAGDMGGALLFNQIRKWALMQNCTFRSSSSEQGGAIAILNIKTFLRIHRCNFSSNNATIGGALYMNSFPLFRQQESAFSLDRIKVIIQDCLFTA